MTIMTELKAKLTLLCLCFALIQHTDSRVLNLKVDDRPLSKSWNCDVIELEVRMPAILDLKCEGKIANGLYVQHNGYCDVTPVHYVPIRATCTYGSWILKDKEERAATDVTLRKRHHRKKRSILGAVAAGVGIVSGVYSIGCNGGWWKCGGSEAQVIQQVIQKYPPSFTTNCPPGDLQKEYIANFGTTEVTVKWTDPSATDRDGDVTSQGQVFGTLNGGSFTGTASGHQHSIVYQATDNDGQSGYCYFSFTVKVKTCDALQWPENGYFLCSKNTILGSICTYRCHEGYQLIGSKDVTCQDVAGSPTWTDIPTCKKISCGAPPDVTNGNASCTDPDHVYNSYCTFACDQGYELKGQVLTVCKADRTWLTAVDTDCKDDEPPEIKCDTSQIFYADRGTTSTSVMWNEPEVSDLIDPHPRLVKVNGPAFGIQLEAGESVEVVYEAIDADGNISPRCTIELRVLDISCGHPLDTLDDANLRFNCSMATYSHGDTCTLHCALNLPLNGTNRIVCEANSTESEEPIGYWHWGNGTKPYCKEINCADIDPPLNGAMVYDWVAARPIATMLCSDQFDIPSVESSFNGIFLCQDSGVWSPAYTKAPDCIVTFSSRGFLLPSEIFYYSGTCGDDDNIKQRFEAIVDDLNNLFVALCPTDTSCSVQNPRVECGDPKVKRSVDRNSQSTIRVRRALGSYQHVARNRKGVKTYKRQSKFWTKLKDSRQKRQAEILMITFDIETNFDFTGLSRKELYDKADSIQLDLLKPAIQQKLDNGTYDFDSWIVTDDSFKTEEYGQVYCNPGYVLDSLFYCKPCPPGYHSNDGLCVPCPIGEYSNSNGSNECTLCPDGFSTRQTAAESLDNCTKLCDPGYYSPDSFAPCAPCRIGFYQSQSGQTSCLPCTISKSTTVTGSNSESDCQYFESKLNKTVHYNNVADISQLKNSSVMLWTKVLGSGTPRASIFIGSAMEVSIRETISFTTEPSEVHAMENVAGPTSRTSWTHVAATWDTTNNLLSVYYRGGVIVDQMSVTPTRSPLLQNDQLSIVAGGDADILISGLRVIDGVISQTDVYTAITSCHISDDTDIVHMGHLRSANIQGISVVTPTTCDPIDECLNNPCGDHKCTNDIGGFTCTCSNGWTGTTCNIPRDYCINNDCQNGATCINKNTDYECHCPPGYGGVICDIPPDNGEWSSWSIWTDCAVSCSNGTRSRTRACDSPPPEQYGQDCVGDDMQVESCNTEPCQVCPALSRGYKSIQKCDTSPSTGTKTCVLTCVPGYAFAKGLDFVSSQNLKCGLETDFEWEPRNINISCSSQTRPGYYRERASVYYTRDVPDGDKTNVVDVVRQKVAAANCDAVVTCSVDVTIENDTLSRRKRSEGSALIITVTITLEDQTDLKIEDFETSGTLSSGLQEILDAFVLLENITQLINTSVSSIFDVTVNGVTYNVDPSTLTFDGYISCDAGQVISEGLCTDCPPGTFKNGDFCAYCERGTYQTLSGQLSCIQCPSGYTTVTIGSSSLQQCTVLYEFSTTVPGTPAPDDSDDESYNTDDSDRDTGKLIISLVCVGVFLTLCVLVILVILIVKRFCVTCRVSNIKMNENEDITLYPTVRSNPGKKIFLSTKQRPETPGYNKNGLQDEKDQSSEINYEESLYE